MKKTTSVKQLTLCSVVLIFVNILLIGVGLYTITISLVLGIALCILGIFGLSTGLKYKKVSSDIKRHLQYDSETDSSSAPSKTETFHVGGVSYQHDEIKELGVLNPQYDMSKKELEEITDQYVKIFKRLFNPGNVQLKKEPENLFDTNAVQVLVDNVLVGYVKSGNSAHVTRLIDHDQIQTVTASITGGKYKRLVPAGNGMLTLDYDKDEFSIQITITLK